MTDVILLTLQEPLLPIDELYELTGNDQITILGDPEAPVGYRVEWDDVVFTMERAADETAVFAQTLHHAESLLSGREDNKARKHLRRIGLAQAVWDIRILPEPDHANKARNLLLGIMSAYEESYFVGDHAFYNALGKRFLGAEETRPKFFVEYVAEDSAEALERKERTLAQLRRERIPTIEHLPVIVDSQQATLRTPTEILARMLALVCIAERAEGQSVADYEQQIEALHLRAVVSPDEWAYAHMDAPIKQDTIKFSQRFESAWALAWVLGLADTLTLPDAFCDVDQLRAWTSAAVTLPRLFRSQPLGTILDMTDWVYRAHWAVNDAELYGTRMPAELIAPVVYERHYALNWVISQQDWDAVSTDT